VILNGRLMGGVDGYTGGTLPYGLSLLVRDLFEKVAGLFETLGCSDGVPVRNRVGARGLAEATGKKPMVDGGTY
jgi:hypothetical protein